MKQRDRLQLLLHLSDNEYTEWIKGTGYQLLQSRCERLEEEWSTLPIYLHPLLPKPSESPVRLYSSRDRFMRIALYAPLVDVDHPFWLRPKVGLSLQTAPKVEVRPIQLKITDVPECVRWHKVATIIKALWSEDPQVDIYGLGTESYTKAVEEAVQVVSMQDDKYCRSIMCGGKTLAEYRFKCNSIFVLNLFLATRHPASFSELWDTVDSTLYVRLHNALCSLPPQGKPWWQIIRAILDNSDTICSPFDLFKEVRSTE